MEDLRALEQQQRDSQRLLASIKLTKSHKLEQRSALEQKLSSLKYSNGELRAQLHRARQVLSKCTRNLANAKLRSDRGTDNHKKTEEKYKQALAFVRKLHTQRRKLDAAMIQFRQLEHTLQRKQGDIVQQVKTKKMELEDARHREQLVIKSIQAAKVKVQDYVEDTIKMRSELSGLESDLTCAQQMEASTKLRAESIRVDMANEKRRHEIARHDHTQKIQAAVVQKDELNCQLKDLESENRTKKVELQHLFEKCVVIQKEEGHDVSMRASDASLDVERIRSKLDDDKVKLLQERAEAKACEDRIKELEGRLLHLQQVKANTKTECEQLTNEIDKESTVLKEASAERSVFMTKYQEEQKRVQDLEDIFSSVQEESKKFDMDAEAKREEMRTLISSEKEKLITLTIEGDEIDKRYQSLQVELQEEQTTQSAKIQEAKNLANDAKIALDEIQKQADEMSKSPQIVDEVEEQEAEEARKDHEDCMNDIVSKQTLMLRGKLHS